jgi:hypothetical protein
MRDFEIRVITKDRNSYLSLTRHCVIRYFVSAGASHLQQFSKPTLRLQPDRRIHISTRQVQNNSQAIELCGSRLPDTAADNIGKSRLPDTHIRIVLPPGQSFTLRNDVLVAEPEKSHGGEYQLAERRSCLSSRSTAPGYFRYVVHSFAHK